MQPRAHPLFHQHPLTGTVNLSTGPAPTPYHIYDGYGLFIGGTANLAAVQQRPAWQASFALLGQLGLGQTRRLSRQPWVELAIVNPLGVGLAHNGVASAMTKNAVNNVRYFDPATATLTLNAMPYRDLGFTPHFVQYMDGFKFVYLQP